MITIADKILRSWMITSEVDTKGGRLNCLYSMKNTPDNIRAAAILKQIKGCKVEDNNSNQFTVADVKCFNGQVSFIGLKNVDGDVKYATLDCYMEMASVA